MKKIQMPQKEKILSLSVVPNCSVGKKGNYCWNLCTNQIYFAIYIKHPLVTTR